MGWRATSPTHWGCSAKHWSFMVHFSWWTLGAPLGIFRNYEGMSLAKMVSDIEWVNMSWSFLGCVRRCVSVKYQIMSPMHLSDSNKIAWRKYCIMDILTHLRNSTPHNWKKNCLLPTLEPQPAGAHWIRSARRSERSALGQRSVPTSRTWCASQRLGAGVNGLYPWLQMDL